MSARLKKRCAIVYRWMKESQTHRNRGSLFQNGVFQGLRAALSMIVLGKRASYGDGTEDLDALFSGDDGDSGSSGPTLSPAAPASDFNIEQLRRTFLECKDLNVLRAREEVLVEMLNSLKVNAQEIADAISAVRLAIKRIALEERNDREGEGGRSETRSPRPF